MKKIIGSLLICAASVAQVPTDAIVVSTETKSIIQTTTKEWRKIEFEANRETGDIQVRAVYEEVVRVDGNVKSASVIREAFLPWNQATNIAPALVLVREQFKAAMPLILTNTP